MDSLAFWYLYSAVMFLCGYLFRCDIERYGRKGG